MDAYGQYELWRRIRRVGVRNRRLAAMLGDFVYETSSAEDESRRILEMLHEEGEKTLSGRALKSLRSFTSEHNREQRRSEGVEETHLSWGLVDHLSRKIIQARASASDRRDTEFTDNLEALNRMFDSAAALRRFRNQVDHRAPSDNGGSLQFYRDSASAVSSRMIWGWTEVAASYWSNLTSIGQAVALAASVDHFSLDVTPTTRPFQWPPSGLSIHALRVLAGSGIGVPAQQMNVARIDWLRLANRWNRLGH